MTRQGLLRARLAASAVSVLGSAAAIAQPLPAPTAEPAAATPAPRAAASGADRATPSARPAEQVGPARSEPVDADLAPIGDDEKRSVPDYDGRGEEPVDAGDVALWVPRTIVAPAYLVSEYVIRWPLGQLVTVVEKNDLPAIVIDFFTFGPEKKAGIVPTALVDFGLRTSVGFYFFWDDYLAHGQDLRVRAATGGAHWFLANVAHRSWLDQAKEATSAEARFEYSRRPDGLYYGTGPRAPDDAASAYEAQRIEGGARFRSRYWRTSRLETYLAVRDMSFYDEGCCPPDDVRLGDRVASGAYPFPPGWADGYTVMLQRAELSLDTRRLRDSHVGEASDYVSPSGTGGRLALRGQLTEGLREAPTGTARASARYHVASYGGTVGGFLDLGGHQRVVGVSAIVDFADPLFDGGTIPFTELVSLGGERPLRGFLPGRLLGRSSLVWRLEYRWPVWVWLDGTMHYSVGNVFGEHLQDFDAELLRQSFGIGIRTIAARDHSFEALLAFGTEPFEDGGGVETVRFVLGTSSGF